VLLICLRVSKVMDLSRSASFRILQQTLYCSSSLGKQSLESVSAYCSLLRMHSLEPLLLVVLLLPPHLVCHFLCSNRSDLLVSLHLQLPPLPLGRCGASGYSVYKCCCNGLVHCIFKVNQSIEEIMMRGRWQSNNISLLWPCIC